MRCDDVRNLLFEFHDGTLAGAARGTTHAAISEHLQSCEICRVHLADVADMSHAAAAWQDETPPPWRPPALPGAAPGGPPTTQRRWLHATRTWLPLAACLALTVLVVSGAEVGSTDDGFYLRFGRPVQAPVDVVTSSELRSAVAQLRAEQNLQQELLSEALLSANRSQRRRELEAVLALVSTQLDVQTEETVDSLRFLIDRQQQDQRRLTELDQQLQRISYRIPDREKL